MATGDILSATIGTRDANGLEGMYVDVLIEGFAPGATYNFGISADNAPSAATPFLTVVSEGYNTAGVLGTITRTVYLTSAMRRAYPNHAQTNETDSSGNLLVRCALSDYVYDDDNTGAGKSGTAPTFTAPAGWVTNTAGGAQTSASVTALTATNNSTLDYPKAFGRFTIADRDQLTTASLPLSCVVFHPQGRNFRPVACVIFTATDTSAHTATVTVTQPTIDPAATDPVPIIEWRATLDLSTFTDDNVVTANYAAYPWVGDADSVYNSSNLVWTLDVDSSRGYPTACVDSVLGVDSAGAFIGPNNSPENIALAAATPFATMHYAINRLRNYNNTNNGRASAQDCRLYLAAGMHNVVGGDTATTESTTGTNLVIQPLSGASVTLTPNSSSTSRYIRARYVKILNCNFERGADYYFTRAPNTTSAITYENCTFADTRASNTYQTFDFDWGSRRFIHCTISKCRVSQSMMRGCTLPAGYTLSNALTVGTIFTWGGAGLGYSSLFNVPSSGAGEPQECIIAFNKFLDLSIDAISWAVNDGTYPLGNAIVQNIFDFHTTSSEPGIRIASDGTVSQTNGYVISHNVFYNERCNLFYNDSGALIAAHLNHKVDYNTFEYYANKGDLFGTANAARIGNFAIRLGVLNQANGIERGAFDQDFRGLYSKGGTDADPIVLGYVGTGANNFSLLSTSPLLSMPMDRAICEWDIAGNQRNASLDAVGAYRYLAPSGSVIRPRRIIMRLGL